MNQLEGYDADLHDFESWWHKQGFDHDFSASTPWGQRKEVCREAWKSAREDKSMSVGNNPELEQLKQLATATWDGNLISKDACKHLVSSGLAESDLGWNIITTEGIAILVVLRILRV